MPRKVVPLTDTKCRSVKPPQDGTLKLFDGEGLFLQVVQGGSKLWRIKYRFAGKEKLLSLGAYPEVPLAVARELRAKARKALAEGRDPSVDRKASRALTRQSAEKTLEVVAKEWHSEKAGSWTPKNAEKVLGRLKNHVFPWLGGIPIAQVTAPMIFDTLKRVEQQGALDTTRRIRQYLTRIYAYAVTHESATHNVAADLVGTTATPSKKHFASIKDPKVLGRLLRDIEVYEGSLVTRTALALAPMLFCRPGELRGMEWSEIDFDRKEWRVPALRQKLKLENKKDTHIEDYIVPLSRQAMKLIEELRPLTGRGRFVFPSERTAARSMSDGTINAALKRMGYSSKDITGHGFRHTASTMLYEQRKWSRDAIEAQLSHRDHTVRGIYNSAQYMDERWAMMQAWSDYLDVLRDGKPESEGNRQPSGLKGKTEADGERGTRKR